MARHLSTCKKPASDSNSHGNQITLGKEIQYDTAEFPVCGKGSKTSKGKDRWLSLESFLVHQEQIQRTERGRWRIPDGCADGAARWADLFAFTEQWNAAYDEKWWLELDSLQFSRWAWKTSWVLNWQALLGGFDAEGKKKEASVLTHHLGTCNSRPCKMRREWKAVNEKRSCHITCRAIWSGLVLMFSQESPYVNASQVAPKPLQIQ